MKAILPYPLLAMGLTIMWLLLSGYSPGQLLLAVAVSIGATHALAALGEPSPSIRRWLAIPKLFGIVLYDIVRSNVAVASIVLRGAGRPRQSGFVAIPLKLTDPSALALLAIIVSSTPGTAWLDFNTNRREVLIHVFDLVDESYWRDLIANRYERLLLEIFE